MLLEEREIHCSAKRNTLECNFSKCKIALEENAMLHGNEVALEGNDLQRLQICNIAVMLQYCCNIICNNAAILQYQMQ